MLRFVNPAIVTPQAYMLVEGQPSGNARRGLTLIAKNLQNLTNKPNYAKEAYMMPLARFIEENTERMTRFYLELCDVDDFFEQLEIDQYMSMTRRDLSLTITLNEIYATQELLARHVDVLVRPLFRPYCGETHFTSNIRHRTKRTICGSCSTSWVLRRSRSPATRTSPFSSVSSPAGRWPATTVCAFPFLSH